MPDFIHRDDVFKMLMDLDLPDVHAALPISLTLTVIRAALDGLDVVDAVCVVRCADCRYWEPENTEEGDTYGRCRNHYGACENQQTEMNWFCADGEMVEE